MNKIALTALALSFVAAPALAENAPTASITAPVVATKGKMLVAADGSRLAPVYRVAGGSPQIILDGRMVTVPANTLVMNGSKLGTSLTKAQVISLP